MFVASRSRAWSCFFALAASALVSIAVAGAPVRADVSKKPVTSQNDLPRFTYPVYGDGASDRRRRRGDVRRVREARPRRSSRRRSENYDIQDHAALRGLLGLELDFQVLSGIRGRGRAADARS
jgi:hypothetical protein